MPTQAHATWEITSYDIPVTNKWDFRRILWHKRIGIFPEEMLHFEPEKGTAR